MAQYDAIATLYHEGLKDHPYFSKVVHPSLSRMLGEVKGKSLLDVGCGDGVRTMFYKTLGASKVVGLDISPGILSKR